MKGFLLVILVIFTAVCTLVVAGGLLGMAHPPKIIDMIIVPLWLITAVALKSED